VRRRLRHHDEELGERSVRAPELVPIEDETLAVGGGLGDGGDAGGVGADRGLRQRKAGDCAGRAAGQIRAFLLLAAEEPERLRHADRLVGGEKRRHVRVVASEKLHRALVLALRKAEAAVLGRDLHAERAERGEPLEDGLRILAARIDLDGVDLLDEEGAEAFVERGELGSLLLDGFASREHEVERATTEEEAPQEALRLPARLPRRLRDPT
jgi:hypothetical protein